MPGALYVVATPIGHLEDLTERAAATLRTVDRVAAEDTRRARTLLSHLGVRGTALTRLDSHSPGEVIEGLVDKLEAGETIALVTDAGTPSVSDPGAALVRAAADRGLPVFALPGPSAVTAAIAVSGLVEGAFLFLGFIPRKGEKRRRVLARIAQTREPVVLFEAPARTRATLDDLARLMPDRSVCVARELTKLHEEVHRGPLAAVAARIGEGVVRGEVTLVLGPSNDPEEARSLSPPELDRLIRHRLAAGLTAKDVSEELAAELGCSRREIYQRILALRDASPEGEGFSGP